VQLVAAPVAKDFRKSAGPVYIPGQTQRYAARPLVDPFLLGLPSGVRIKPASQMLAKRVLRVEPRAQTVRPRAACHCRDTDSCPASYRDYITFRKSCPFGQVQCCMEKSGEVEPLSTSFRPVPLEPVTVRTSFLEQASQVRPVLIPVSLVPQQPRVVSQRTVGRLEVLDGLEDQTFRKYSDWSTVEKGTTRKVWPTPSPTTQATTTPTPTPPEPVTPYTIVSSSMTVSKLVWETVGPDTVGWETVMPARAPVILDPNASQHPPPLVGRTLHPNPHRSPTYPYPVARSDQEGFFERVGGSIITGLGSLWG
jgi:hypothetical protein